RRSVSAPNPSPLWGGRFRLGASVSLSLWARRGHEAHGGKTAPLTNAGSSSLEKALALPPADTLRLVLRAVGGFRRSLGDSRGSSRLGRSLRHGGGLAPRSAGLCRLFLLGGRGVVLFGDSRFARGLRWRCGQRFRFGLLRFGSPARSLRLFGCGRRLGLGRGSLRYRFLGRGRCFCLGFRRRGCRLGSDLGGLGFALRGGFALILPVPLAAALAAPPLLGLAVFRRLGR